MIPLLGKHEFGQRGLKSEKVGNWNGMKEGRKKEARKERKESVSQRQINQERRKAEQIEINRAECELGVSNTPMSLSHSHTW